MATKIQIRRGLEADLPALSVGELGFTTDTHLLYIGTSTGNVLVQGGGGGGLILPYGNIEKRKDTDLLDNNGLTVYSGGGTDFFVTDPISNDLKQMIIDEDIKIQLWMYKMALRKGNVKTVVDENDVPIDGRQTVRKFTHAEDLTGTASLLTGHTRPVNLGDGVKMLSLQGDGTIGGLFRGSQNSSINSTDVTFVTNNTAHYKGYVKTEVVVTASMIQTDNRIKIPLYDIANSWLINNTFVSINTGGNLIKFFSKKTTQNQTLRLNQEVSFDRANLPTETTNRIALLGIRGVGMGGSNGQSFDTIHMGGGYFQGLYLVNKNMQFNFNGIHPIVTSRALQFRLVASTNGTDFIFGPPLSARGAFRCLGDNIYQTGTSLHLKLNFVNATRTNLVPSKVIFDLFNM